MGKLIRCITSDGLVMATALDSTDIVSKAEEIHSTSAVVTAALGRLLTAVSMMGNALKNSNGSVSVKIDGDGPIGSLVAVSDADGNVRGYAQNNVVEIPLKPNGKLDVSGAVGKGTLYAVKDIGMKEPYNGYVPLVSGEIAEDITSYYAVSEQIPTVCALGVLVNPDLTVKKSGGYIIQLLPAANGDDEVITKLENNIGNMKSVTQLLDEGFDIEEIVKKALDGFEVEVLESKVAAYKCNCSRKRFKKALMSLGYEELNSLANEMPKAETKCQFCGETYSFSSDELKTFIRQIKSNKKEK